MAGRGKFLAAGVALSLGVGAAAATSLAGNGAQTAASQAVTVNIGQKARGKVRGIVVAKQKNSNVTVRVAVSLHGLMAQRRYRVGVYAKPCSQIVDAGDLAIWRTQLRTLELEDIMISSIVSRHGKLTNARSFRIFDLDNVGGPGPIGCWGVNGVQGLDFG